MVTKDAGNNMMVSPRFDSLLLMPLNALSALSMPVLSFLVKVGVVGELGRPYLGTGYKELLPLSDISIPLSLLPSGRTTGKGFASS